MTKSICQKRIGLQMYPKNPHKDACKSQLVTQEP